MNDNTIKVAIFLSEKAGKAVYRESFASLSAAQTEIESRFARYPEGSLRVELTRAVPVETTAE